LKHYDTRVHVDSRLSRCCI